MQSRKVGSTSFVMRIERGEEIVTSLGKFCKDQKIKGGFFYGVGACDNVVLAHYNVGTKKYKEVSFKKPLEMASLTGSIGYEKNLIVHAHAVFADDKMQTIAGHLVSAVVSGTAEVHLIKLPNLPKRFDKKTGLKLFDLK
jgi:predicted DNA-binding protein with PD1-like motif